MENPFSSPYFASTAGRIGLALGLLMIIAILRDRRRGSTAAGGRMATKVNTASWVAAVLLVTLFVGGALFWVLTVLVMTQALREYTTLARLPRSYALVLHAHALATLVAVATRPNLPLLLPLVTMFLLTTAVPIFGGNTVDALRHSGSTIFGFMYIGLGFSILLLIREGEPWGLRLLVIAGTGAALADAGGYLMGTHLGGPSLAPSISPNKTWSGAAGAVLGATVGVVGQSHVIPASWSVPVVVGVIVAVAAGAIWGDLIESFIKRDVGTKDAGDLLTGFGGILDRFDSYLVAIPGAYGAVLVLLGGAP